MKIHSLKASALAIVTLAVLSTPASAELIYGMTAASSSSTSAGLGLVSFDSATPGSVTTIGNFSGVVAGHSVRSIDFRPSNGQLYAVSSNGASGQLYTVNLANASLTAVGSGFTMGANTSAAVEMDFNPVVDAVRILTGGATDNSFRVNATTGALAAQDTNLAWDAGDQNFGTSFNIVAGAYGSNFAGTTSTTLYGWDYLSDSLIRVGGVNGPPSPNTGLMFTVHEPASFLTFNAGVGMDISGATNTLYVTHDDPATGAISSLYTRNLTTGEQTLVGSYGAGLFINDISVTAVPEPATMTMLGLGLAGLIARRRKARAN